MPDLTRIHATAGKCPYCEGTTFVDVSTPHHANQVQQCATCNRYSTRRVTGRVYPHDDPTDIHSPIARMVKIDLSFSAP